MNEQDCEDYVEEHNVLDSPSKTSCDFIIIIHMNSQFKKI